MQFANDINKYTLASTASLRELSRLAAPGSGQCVAARMELQSRIPDNSIREKNAQIEGLESPSASSNSSSSDETSDLEEAQSKLTKISELIESGADYEESDIKEIIG